ncbi:hypothetical protein RI103_34010 [Paraburkholderia sp. FT54]|uniref:hypothetical protein n=1 Tax=Paraburkholderia sp. FT54 TaxID=3074437 RepID=UPI00287732D3|nr:hypothetical protein [Paraburkholderia sp. FT54]WNC94916.1 hypothetical protein RI103_34010 [Paraburkholderia sp. FT54]
MARIPGQEWDSSTLHDRSRAWFVTKWPGNYAGAPDMEMLFVIEIPNSRCLCMKLFPSAGRGWEHQVLNDLAATHQAPDALITDDTRLQHVLVTVGSSFQQPAIAYLDKPITLMPAIHRCLVSLTEILNQPLFQSQLSTEKRNEALELWRIGYNDRDGASAV